jgi:peptidoglycan lytic transglycosylase
MDVGVLHRGAAGMPSRRVAVGGALVLALLSACAHPERRPEAQPQRPAKVQTGLASYYARMHEGHRTASGEPYRGERMTCAHRTFPFGSVLRVTDLENGRSVLVKVTDRGPFEPGRIVDLSLAAARALGMLERGVARVKLERVE